VEDMETKSVIYFLAAFVIIVALFTAIMFAGKDTPVRRRPRRNRIEELIEDIDELQGAKK